MVQFFKGSADTRDAALGQLSAALGQNLGKGVSSYYANKALDEVLNNEELKNAPQSERMGALQKALMPYGDTGRELLMGRMQADQQAMQEKQQKEQNIKGDILRRRLSGEAISEKEKSMFTPQEELAIAKHEQIAELSRFKALNKAPPGGITAQPVPAEVNQKISQVLGNSKDLSADELKQAFDQAQVPPVYSNGYVESRRQETKPTFEPESEKLEAKRVSELATSIEKDYNTAKNENIRLNRMEELSEKEGISTPLMIKALDSIGLPIGILSNPDTEEYRKLETDFIRDARDVFPGGRITNYEIQSYLKTIPTLMNSREGREAVIRNRKLFNEAKEIKYHEYKNILKENSGKKPPNLGILLEERTADKISELEETFKQGLEKQTEKFQTPIPMIDPKGRRVNIPPNQIESALKAGAKFGS